MQSILVNPKISGERILDLKNYKEMKNNHQFLLYADNILEGITLLNDLTNSDEILSYCHTIYQPIDQPIYVFSDKDNNYYSIKVCGAFDKWKLPDDVYSIKTYVDLPDYILYSIDSKKAILAGENTETASVGNSQWQREGRKLAAARNKVPFIYQTFYSGKDESQNTIREPSSLQVYNQILYTARYKTPSLVAYFENNFEGAKTRNRVPEDSQELFSNYIKSVILCDVNDSQENITLKRKLETEFLEHMLGYLGEGKYSTSNGTIGTKSRLDLDLPTIDSSIRRNIVDDKKSFSKDLINYIYNINNDFSDKYDLTDVESKSLLPWTSYMGKNNIKNLLEYLSVKGSPAKSYISGSAKVGIAKTEYCKEYLLSKFPNNINEIKKALGDYQETLVMPLRIHKKSNGNLTFSPDPESGEIVAFCELFGYDMQATKTRPVIGYCIVDTPSGFDFKSKHDTKLYKAIANYIDILILDDKKLITSYVLSEDPKNNYHPVDIESEHPLSSTEEMAVVSTFLNQSTIKSDWDLCFIHTHHSSWQQIFINGKQEKIGRVSTKLDLIMQQDNKFMLAEGKNQYQDILNDPKIQQAMRNSGDLVDRLYKQSNIKFDAFLYNLATNPNKDPEYYAGNEEKSVEGGIKRGHFDDIAEHDNFVVIIVYTGNDYKTKFRLVFSDSFDKDLKQQLEIGFL